jgi:ADP-ribose pyrophosphatase
MWKTLSEKIIHENNWYKIAHKRFEMPNSVQGDYFVMQSRGASYIIPVKDGKIIMIEQYRYPINRRTIELPGGGVKDGSNYRQTAEEELLEETGYTGRLEKIGEFSAITGVSDEICEAYIATDLRFVGGRPEETENFKLHEYPIEKVFQMIDNGQIIDGQTLAALALARNKLIIDK